MGAAVSAVVDDGVRSCSSSGLVDLPENCTTYIFIKLDPTEICKMARVNRSLHEASSVDLVWESKLPCNYQVLIKRVLGQEMMMINKLSKREIYAELCRFNRFDDGTKEFSLDKRSGNVCLSLSSKVLKITGIDDRRYWSFIHSEESRFQFLSYLHQIWWVEVVGEMEFPFPIGIYSVFFKLHLGRPYTRFGLRLCNVDEVHGWDSKPVRFQLWTSNDQHALSECYLQKTGRWVNYHVGDFVVENADTSTKIKISMLQIDCTHSKGGLALDSVFIYQREKVRKRLLP